MNLNKLRSKAKSLGIKNNQMAIASDNSMIDIEPVGRFYSSGALTIYATADNDIASQLVEFFLRKPNPLQSLHSALEFVSDALIKESSWTEYRFSHGSSIVFDSGSVQFTSNIPAEAKEAIREYLQEV